MAVLNIFGCVLNYVLPVLISCFKICFKFYFVGMILFIYDSTGHWSDDSYSSNTLHCMDELAVDETLRQILKKHRRTDATHSPLFFL